MKLYIVGALLFGLLVNSQVQPDQTFNFRSELLNQIKFPKSPEATAFEKYGNTQVNLYTGQPNINIPLHTLAGREFNVPIALTYDASGIKVDQIATSAGLGWNLNVGGRISRIANGRPDDVMYPTNAYDSNTILDFETLNNRDFTSNLSFVAYHDLVKSLKDGCKDLLIDVYSLNVVGIHDYIVIDIESQQAHTLINPNIKVTGGYYPLEWIVTDVDGTKYYFGTDGNNETAETAGIADNAGMGGSGNPCATSNITSVTSWLLKKIISKNGLDVFTFDYLPFNWLNNLFGQSVTSATNNLIYQAVTTIWSTANINYNYTGSYKTSQRMVKQIKLNGNTLADFNYKSRNDIAFANNGSGNALDNILLYKFAPIGGTTALATFKKISFNHSYFGSTATNSSSTINQRLKLDDVIISGESATLAGNNKKYSFTYISPEAVPPTTSNAQDFLGLYNGCLTNQNLVAGYSDIANPIAGANRKFDLMFALNGTLETISYPTKGYTKFEYEQHQSKAAATSVINNKITFGSNGIGSFIEYNVRTQHLHNLMIDAGVTSIETSLMRIPESGMYIVEGHGAGSFLIHRPLCDNLGELPVYNRNSNLNDNALAVMPICRNPSLVAKNQIWTQFSSSTMNGSVLYDTFAVNRSVYLRAGTYQLTTWGREIGPGGGGPGGGGLVATVPSFVEIYKNVAIIPENDKIQGFRIKSISDFTSNNVLASEKNYQYTEKINNTLSSGNVLCDLPQPLFYTLSKNDLTTEYIVRTAARIENTPHIVYKNVFEILKNNTSTEGYMQHQFICENYSTGLVSINGIKSYFNPFADGKEFSTINFSANNKKISEKRLEYRTTTLPNTFGGITATTDFSNINKVLMWAHFPGDDDLVFQHIAIENLQSNPLFQPNWACYCGAPICQPLCYPGHDSFQFNAFIGQYSNYLLSSNFESGYTNLIRQTSKLYNNNLIAGSTTDYESIIDVETYNYDSLNLMIEKGKSNDGTLSATNEIVNGLKTKYTYDDAQFSGNPEKITDEEVYRVTNSSESLLSKRKNLYSDVGTSIGNQSNFLTEIKNAKGNGTLESRLLLDYDSTSKNIINSVSPSTATIPNNAYDSYIFGYNNAFAIAKLSGVKYSQISTARINALKDKSNVVISSANDALLITELNLLRTDFPDAQITTYTYNPDFGVTSVTDPKGDIQFYIYDELGRLQSVKDKNGNILSENQYNYKP